jgi:hypothetical protein
MRHFTNRKAIGSGHPTDLTARAFSRRQFFGAAAGVTGLALGAGLWLPGSAWAGMKEVAPKPIPGGLMPLGEGTELFHFFLPGPGNEPSTITDFDGFVAIARIQGTGTGTDPESPEDVDLLFDADMRFMTGQYIGVDGNRHRGTFALV